MPAPNALLLRAAGLTRVSTFQQPQTPTTEEPVLEDISKVVEAAHALAAAIARRDEQSISSFIHDDFVLRTPGGQAVDAQDFVAGIQQIPGEFVFVRLEGVHVEMTPSGALVTGIQSAQLRIGGEAVLDRRPFVDWFVEGDDGAWRVQVALNLPPCEPEAAD